MAATKVERRLAAILAADVVGYSRLMEADEAGTFGRLKELRRELIEPVLREHGGRFVDLKGGGAIVEFASVTDAVETAVAIQPAMQARDPDLPEDRRIRYRVGINPGINPNDAEVHVILGFASTLNGQWADARASTAKALELNPSSADILNLAAGNMSYLGKPDRGAEMCDRSFQLNPSPACWYNIDCPENYFFVGRYEDAVDAIDRFRARTVMPNSYLVYRAAGLAERGRTEEAVAAVEELAQLDPTMSLEMFLNTNLFAHDQEMQRILDSACNAGVRACAAEGELSFLESPRRLPGCLTQ